MHFFNEGFVIINLSGICLKESLIARHVISLSFLLGGDVYQKIYPGVKKIRTVSDLNLKSPGNFKYCIFPSEIYYDCKTEMSSATYENSESKLPLIESLPLELLRTTLLAEWIQKKLDPPYLSHDVEYLYKQYSNFCETRKTKIGVILSEEDFADSYYHIATFLEKSQISQEFLNYML